MAFAQFLPRRRTPKGSRPIQKARKVINEIVKVLQQESFRNEVGIQTTEVFVGGSVGQGTTVQGHYDLDLVIFSRSIDYKEAAKNGYEDLLSKMTAFLEKQLAPNYTFLRQTSVAIKFRYFMPEGGPLEVDLLLSPFCGDHNSYLQDLREIKPQKRWMFSVSASKFQTKFIKGQPIQVRELIGRAKAWRNVVWKDDSIGIGRPKSYLISLLVITAYHNLDNPRMHSFKELARKVGEEIVEMVEEISTTPDLDFDIPGTSDAVSSSDLLPSRPRIVDPVNPANNVYLSGVIGRRGDNKWSMLEDRISEIDITITAEKIMEAM